MRLGRCQSSERLGGPRSTPPPAVPRLPAGVATRIQGVHSQFRPYPARIRSASPWSADHGCRGDEGGDVLGQLLVDLGVPVEQAIPHDAEGDVHRELGVHAHGQGAAFEDGAQGAAARADELGRAARAREPGSLWASAISPTTTRPARPWATANDSRRKTTRSAAGRRSPGGTGSRSPTTSVMASSSSSRLGLPPSVERLPPAPAARDALQGDVGVSVALAQPSAARRIACLATSLRGLPTMPAILQTRCLDIVSRQCCA